MDKYEVNLADKVIAELRIVKQYITQVLVAPQAAVKRTDVILRTIQLLETFPKRGFNADAKLGRHIVPGQQTFGLSLVDGKYIALYLIDEHHHRVRVFDLVSAQTNYAELFISS